MISRASDKAHWQAVNDSGPGLGVQFRFGNDFDSLIEFFFHYRRFDFVQDIPILVFGKLLCIVHVQQGLE